MSGGNRVYAAGFRLIYAEDVRVRHPARASWTEINQKLARVFAGARDLDAGSSWGARPLIDQLGRTLVPPVRTAYVQPGIRESPASVGSSSMPGPY